MKTILEKFLSLLFCLINFVLGLFPSREFVKINMVENITNPQQVIWESDEKIIFVVDENVWEYVIPDNTNTHIGTREPNEFVGLNNDGSILLCEIKNFIITSPDEFSTKFTIRKRGVKKEEIEEEHQAGEEGEKELYFFETIRPIHLDSERIIAVTAVDFLQTHYYVVDIQTEEMREIGMEEALKEAGDIKDTNLNIPKDIEVKKTYVRNKDRYVIEDIFGNLYVYIKQNLKSKVLDYINQSLGTYTKK